MLNKLILFGVGYLFGNPKAMNNFNNIITKTIQGGIDTLNKKGVANETILETENKD